MEADSTLESDGRYPQKRLSTGQHRSQSFPRCGQRPTAFQACTEPVVPAESVVLHTHKERDHSRSRQGRRRRENHRSCFAPPLPCSISMFASAPTQECTCIWTGGEVKFLQICP